MFSFFTVQDSSDTTVLSHVRGVAYVEDFYDCTEVCEPVSPLQVLKKVQRKQAPLKPIIASGFMSRGQVSYTFCIAKQS